MEIHQKPSARLFKNRITTNTNLMARVMGEKYKPISVSIPRWFLQHPFVLVNTDKETQLASHLFNLEELVLWLLPYSSQSICISIGSQLLTNATWSLTAMQPNQYSWFDSVKYSCDTSSFTLSERFVPSLKSLRLISSPSHRQSTFEPCALLMSLSRTWTASKLCRWLAGTNQRILGSYFIKVNFLHIYGKSL